MADYDVIVIGAGNGGLTASLTLAQAGIKTLLLERHNLPGGCATSFIRGRFEFEVALHQLSGIGTDQMPGPLKNTFDTLGISDELELVRMDNLYRIVYPGVMDVVLKADRTEMVKALKEAFPKQADNIDRFIDMLWEYCNQWIHVEMIRDPEASPVKYPLYFKYALKPTQLVFDEYIPDPLLQTAIGIYCSYMGQPPSKLAFRDFALVLWAYTEFKPYHIKSGSQALSNSILDAYRRSGGQVRFNCGVKKILAENNHVVGVVTDDGEELTADRIVSNASTLTTYFDMLDADLVPEDRAEALNARNVGVSAFTLFMGFDCEPEALGIKETTNFIVTGNNPRKSYDLLKTLDTPNFMLFSCYDVDDPDFSPEGTCQAAFLSLNYAEPWLSVPPHRYNEIKYDYARRMLDILDQVFPACRSHIEELEVATPLTHMRYLSHPGGAIYGFDQTIKDTDLMLERKSPVNGLFHTGSWVASGGFQPTLMSGQSTARAVIRSMDK